MNSANTLPFFVSEVIDDGHGNLGGSPTSLLPTAFEPGFQSAGGAVSNLDSWPDKTAHEYADVCSIKCCEGPGAVLPPEKSIAVGGSLDKTTSRIVYSIVIRPYYYMNRRTAAVATINNSNHTYKYIYIGYYIFVYQVPWVV